MIVFPIVFFLKLCFFSLKYLEKICPLSLSYMVNLVVTGALTNNLGNLENLSSRTWVKVIALIGKKEIIHVMGEFYIATQLDWGGLGGWLNNMSVCLWGCFWIKVAFELVNSVKLFPLPQCGWSSTSLWRAGIEQKGKERENSVLPAWSIELRRECSPTLHTPGSQSCWLGLSHTSHISDGSPAWGGQISGLLGLHNCIRQLNFFFFSNCCIFYFYF